MLAVLDAVLAAYTAPIMPDLPPLQGGVMGYLGYDVVREVEHLPDTPHDDRGMPDAVMSIIGSLAAFDHWRQRMYLIESVPVLHMDAADVDREYDAAIERVRASAAKLSLPLSAPPVEPPEAGEAPPEVRSTMADGVYQQAVEVAKEHILAGDIFQVVLAQRYDIDLQADPFDFYRVLRQVNPSPYMYFLRHPDITIAGSSPEPMVQVLGRKVVSRPIAGTRRRGRTEDDDRRMAGELKENPKEVAEHIMLVDLARNDVGPRRQVRHRQRRRTDDAREVQPRDASHVAGAAASCVDGQDAHRRAARHVAGGHGERRAEGARDGDHRRARTREARPVRRCRRLRRLQRQPRHGHRHPHHVRRRATAPRSRPARASWPTACPTTRTSSAATRPQP